jgi:hypothetical protein
LGVIGVVVVGSLVFVSATIISAVVVGGSGGFEIWVL